jgi:2-dehydro-3-deoxyphosphogluconate aldolase/(4S)-4-hydroxy-2-oxoglutarate aldolase
VIPDFLRDVPIVGLLRGGEPEASAAAAEASARGGVRVLEVTMDGEDPVGQLAAIRRRAPDVVLGAGTVLSIDEAETALAAGATFVVSPHLDEELVRHCAGRGVPVFPGAATATEVVRAWRAGATMVKLFPAGPLGPGYVRALLEPLRRIDLIVTGGVSADNLGDFLAAGARAAALGGWLFPKPALASGDVSVVEERARALVRACRAAADGRAQPDTAPR